jgi:uncharacterized iron-regulated membrane protein/ABC-type Fe3+-hydroxamate transport system substrate-binding protein
MADAAALHPRADSAGRVMMRSLALRGLLRRIVTRVHRWTGLAIMACMLVAAVTGVWLTFRVEMDRLVNPELRTVQAGPRPLPLGTVVDGITSRFSNASVHTLVLQDRATDSIGAYLDSKDGTPLELDRVFFNPYTGAFLGGSNTRQLIFTRANTDTLIDRLHYSLWMNSAGLTLMGLVAGTWLLTSIVGLVLAWPRAWLRIRNWLPVLSARTHRGTYQASYQLHRAVGVWLFPVLMLLSFTSFYQNMPQYVRPVVNALSPLAARPAGHPVADGTPLVSIDRALEALAERFPEARAQSIGFDRRDGRYSILFRLPGDLSPDGDNWVFVDMASGGIIGEKIDRTSLAGDRFLTWIFPLHTGTAFGLPGRIVIALAGLGLIAMMATGFYVWGTKWRMRRRAHMARKVASWAIVGIAATLVVLHAQAPYPRAFTDAKGHKVTLTAKPVRIASTVLGIDENLMDLVDPSRIVAMTEIAKTMPDVSNIASRVPAEKAIIGSPQKVVDAKPDLVLSATYTASLADFLIARKLPVYQFSEWGSVDALLKNFEVLGQLVGEEQKAAAVLKADRAVLAAAAQKKWPRPIRAIYYSEGIVFAAGTVPSQVLALAGFADAASAFGLSNYVKSSPMLIKNLNPDVVLFGEDNDEEQKKTAAMFKTAEYQAIAAVKAGKVYAIPGKHITTTSHLIVHAVTDAQTLVASGMR